MRHEVERFGVRNPDFAATGLHRQVEQHRTDIADRLDHRWIFGGGVDHEDVIVGQVEGNSACPVATLIVLPTAIHPPDDRTLLGNRAVGNVIEIQLSCAAQTHRVFA